MATIAGMRPTGTGVAIPQLLVLRSLKGLHPGLFICFLAWRVSGEAAKTLSPLKTMVGRRRGKKNSRRFDNKKEKNPEHLVGGINSPEKLDVLISGVSI